VLIENILIEEYTIHRPSINRVEHLIVPYFFRHRVVFLDTHPKDIRDENQIIRGQIAMSERDAKGMLTENIIPGEEIRFKRALDMIQRVTLLIGHLLFNWFTQGDGLNRIEKFNIAGFELALIAEPDMKIQFIRQFSDIQGFDFLDVQP